MAQLKIAMLVRQFSPHGGLELYAHKVVEGLLANDVCVTVVCRERKSQLEHKNLKFKDVADTCKLRNKAARLSSLFHDANESLKDLDVDLVHSQHCPTNVADVVTFHNHSTKRLSEVGLWWERKLNEIKRGFVPAYKLRYEQDEILLRRAHCLVFPAEVMREDFFEVYPFLGGPPPKPYVVAHPGASLSGNAAVKGAVSCGNDERGTAAARDSGFDEQSRGQSDCTERTGDSGAQPANAAFVFLFVGRGYRKKGLDILLGACAMLSRSSSRKFQLHIAGLSAKPADLLRINLLGLQGCVKYLGFQKDMDAVYQNAQSIILPSRVEPFGMAPVQAMQRGLVPIVSRVAGVAEVLHDGDDALILQDHLSASELASLMERLMNDQALLGRLSANALKTAEKVSWEETVRRTLQAYEITLKAKGLKTTN